eukprot:TRINITY_DN120915_c0_g1_i1.p1 TRINITY_DN120915_c0_g1~~TRINITY_DN120915_c0_g1_i1.p1  ORF type:complete len:272 (+),score=20.75 TRINITY_DN120915_c0_g1_i1:27-842(+)
MAAPQVTCAICLEALPVVSELPVQQSSADASRIVHGPTGTACERHTFHRSCLLTYLASAQSSALCCPLCRVDWQASGGLVERDASGNVLRRFWPQQSAHAPSSTSRSIPDVAAPPTRNVPPEGTVSAARMSATKKKQPPAADDPPMRIRTDYVRQRRGGPMGARGGEPTMMRCPITGSLVPAESASGHLQQVLRGKAAGDKHGAPLVDAAGNLAAFAARRPDLLGDADSQVQLRTDASSPASVGAAAMRQLRQVESGVSAPPLAKRLRALQ